MLNSREIRAFCLAPATAPAVAIVTFGAMSQLLIIAVVSYVAAFVLGRPLYLTFRRRLWSLGRSCLVAGVVAGGVTGALLTATLLFAVSSTRFMSDPIGVEFFSFAGLLVGAGLGLAAGAALWVLLSSNMARTHGA